MRNIVFFDDEDWYRLLPLTYTKPCTELRMGILSLSEKWIRRMQEIEFSHITQAHLSKKYTTKISSDNFLIKSNVIATNNLVKSVEKLSLQEALMFNDVVIAARVSDDVLEHFSTHRNLPKTIKKINAPDSVQIIQYPEHLFLGNAQAIEEDFEWITKGRTSAEIESHNQVLGRENIFVEEGATIECSILNAREGKIYIGKNAKILDGVMMRRGIAICDNSLIKMGAKIYGATTIGPGCSAGGEIKNVVMTANSNKGHEGYLGNAVLGEWCNLGADTNASNLKNTYKPVKLWDIKNKTYRDTNHQFVGLIMGDHSKCSINTMFNTGTVVGICCNLYGEGFHHTYIPSFSWGPPKRYATYKVEKAIEVASLVFDRRKLILDTIEKDILREIFQQTRTHRRT